MALWKASDHGIVEGRGGSVNKELEFRSWHCGRQGGEVQIKSSILDHGIVEGRGGS